MVASTEQSKIGFHGERQQIETITLNTFILAMPSECSSQILLMKSPGANLFPRMWKTNSTLPSVYFRSSIKATHRTGFSVVCDIQNF